MRRTRRPEAPRAADAARGACGRLELLQLGAGRAAVEAADGEEANASEGDEDGAGEGRAGHAGDQHDQLDVHVLLVLEAVERVAEGLVEVPAAIAGHVEQRSLHAQPKGELLAGGKPRPEVKVAVVDDRLGRLVVRAAVVRLHEHLGGRARLAATQRLLAAGRHIVEHDAAVVHRPSVQGAGDGVVEVLAREECGKCAGARRFREEGQHLGAKVWMHRPSDAAAQPRVVKVTRRPAPQEDRLVQLEAVRSLPCPCAITRHVRLRDALRPLLHPAPWREEDKSWRTRQAEQQQQQQQRGTAVSCAWQPAHKPRHARTGSAAHRRSSNKRAVRQRARA